jgi:hypothetical protein
LNTRCRVFSLLHRRTILGNTWSSTSSFTWINCSIFTCISSDMLLNCLRCVSFILDLNKTCSLTMTTSLRQWFNSLSLTISNQKISLLRVIRSSCFHIIQALIFIIYSTSLSTELIIFAILFDSTSSTAITLLIQIVRWCWSLVKRRCNVCLWHSLT